MDGRWNQYMAYFALTDGEILSFFGTLIANGFNGISLDFNLFVDEPRSNAVTVRKYDPAAAPPYDAVTTPSVEDFRRIISLAKSLGLQINVRGHYYISETYLAAHPDAGDYSATIYPRSITTWLESNLSLLRPYLQVFQELGVDRFTTFTENDAIERYVAELQAYFTEVGSIFGGGIGFEESTHIYLMGLGHTPELVERPFDQLVVRFWNWTDKDSLLPRGRGLMVEWSAWDIPLETQNDQRLSQLTQEFVRFWTPAQVFYRSTYPGHEIVWGEIGTYPADGISRGLDYLWEYVRGHEVFDLQEFNDAWAAFLTASAALGMDGIEVWYTPLCDKDELYVFNSSIKTDSSTFSLIGAFFRP
jgi:sugar phosphate isomerase/epimerase